MPCTDVTNITTDGTTVTVSAVTTYTLSALLTITVVITVMIIGFLTIKLLRDKANMNQVISIQAMPEQDLGEISMEREPAIGSKDYEDIQFDAYKASDIDTNANAAYSTIRDL